LGFRLIRMLRGAARKTLSLLTRLALHRSLRLLTRTDPRLSLRPLVLRSRRRLLQHLRKKKLAFVAHRDVDRLGESDAR
jgi:hypothetical protein